MKKLVTIFLVIILAGSVTIPNVFSDDGKNINDDKNQENDNHGNTTGNDNNVKDNDTKDNDQIHFGFSNATNIHVTLPNGTKVPFIFSNGTNVGQQISSFIHQIRDAFKQQETQAKQIIKDCREQAKNASPADRKNIMNECKVKLKDLKTQLHSTQKQFQTDFKQFRAIVVDNNQENHEKSQSQNTIKNQTQDIDKQKGLEQKLQHQKGQKQGHGKQD